MQPFFSMSSRCWGLNRASFNFNDLSEYVQFSTNPSITFWNICLLTGDHFLSLPVYNDIIRSGR